VPVDEDAQILRFADEEESYLGTFVFFYGMKAFLL
jgi:hypothetical protein